MHSLALKLSHCASFGVFTKLGSSSWILPTFQSSKRLIGVTMLSIVTMSNGWLNVCDYGVASL